MRKDKEKIKQDKRREKTKDKIKEKGIRWVQHAVGDKLALMSYTRWSLSIAFPRET